MKLKKLGWNAFFEKNYLEVKKDGYIPARVLREDKGRYVVAHEDGECRAVVSGKMRHNSNSISDFPAVGDWVVIGLINHGEEGIIYSVLDRKSKLTRKAPVAGGRKVRDVMGRQITLGGSTEEQIVAANIDVIFIVAALDDTFNIRRMERFVLLAYNSGAVPVIVLNKEDLCDDIIDKISQVEEIAPGVDIYSISAVNNTGVDRLRVHIKEGSTVGMFGTSGAGKSTLINAILNEQVLETGDVREKDGKGRHTTTWREIVMIPSGGVIIDTPGMRELQIWSDEEELDNMFTDIVELEGMCKFRDCSHKSEPGCAIRKAIEDGTLDQGRYDNYLLMKIEVGYLSGRIDEKKDREIKKIMTQSQRYMQGQQKRRERMR